MAGWLFSLESENDVEKCFVNGFYSTKIKIESRATIPFEGTFADYSSMKEGDNVYFFSKRKIYGIGKLINLDGQDCVFQNYKESSEKRKSEDSKFLVDLANENPWVTVFIPEPIFFKIGVDMDEVLSSKENKFISIRSFWKLSFIKLDDNENKTLFDIILRKNEKNINKNEFHFKFNETSHINILKKLEEESERFKLSLKDFLKNLSKEDFLNHEMAIEAAVINQISKQDDETIKTLGKWDFLNHQVVASPFKPIDYMDKIDVFGYKKIEGFETISKFLVMEIKKFDVLKEDLNQLLKYVDWVAHNYASNKYGMIEAILLGYKFEHGILDELKNIERNYMSEYRPPKFEIWRNIKLIKYSCDKENGKLTFEKIN